MNLQNMNSHQKHNIHIIEICAVIFFILVFFVHGHRNVNKSYQQSMACQDTEIHSIHKYNHKHRKLDTKLMRSAKTSTDPIVKSIAYNKYDNTVAKNTLLHFFTIFYNWHSAKRYNDRPKRLRKYVNRRLLQNKHLFPIVKNSYKTHTNYIDAKGLNYQFNNLNTYYLRSQHNNAYIIADAQYEKWYSRGRNQTVGATWYQIIYNISQHKIIGIKQLYNNPTLHSYSD